MASPTRLHKVHTGGNDLLVHIANQRDEAPSTDAVTAWCDRRTGVGASGFVSCTPTEEPIRSTERVAWELRRYTADGTERAADGDELRAAARILIDEHYVDLAAAETLPLQIGSQIHDIQPSGTGGFHLDLGRWRLSRSEPTVAASGVDVPRPGLELSIADRRYIVIALADRSELDRLSLRIPPRIDPEPVDAVTITFTIPEDPLVRDGVGRLLARAWASDDPDTEVSGGAAAATALAVRHWAGSGAPNHWRVTGDYGAVQVRMFATEEGEHLGVAGGCERIFDTAIAAAQPLS